MTILVLRFSSLGNVAMTVPVLASLSARYPNDRFIVVSKKRLSDLFYGLPNVVFHEADFSYGGLKGIFHLFHELRAYHIDHVVDLQDVLRTRLLRFLFRLAGKPISVIDYGRTEKRRITLTGYRGEQLPTETDRYIRTFRSTGWEADTSFCALPINTTAQQSVRERYGTKQGQWVGVAPFAKHKSNILPYRQTRELIMQIAARPNTRVYLFGAGAVEIEMMRQWASVIPNVVSAAGQLTLAEELELMRSLDVMLCMDSANQHLASLVGLRVVTVWCATHPALGYYGWKQQPDDCVQIPISCRPCSVHGRNRCRFRNFACKEINTNEIWEKLFH